MKPGRCKRTATGGGDDPKADGRDRLTTPECDQRPNASNFPLDDPGTFVTISL